MSCVENCPHADYCAVSNSCVCEDIATWERRPKPCKPRYKLVAAVPHSIDLPFGISRRFLLFLGPTRMLVVTRVGDSSKS